MCTETNYYNHIWQSINYNSQKKIFILENIMELNHKGIKEKKIYTTWICFIYHLTPLHTIIFIYTIQTKILKNASYGCTSNTFKT